MPITGVFFIPSNPNASTALSTVTERLHSRLADEPTPIGRWAVEHKLMRDTPSCLPASASQRPTQPRYMQFLSLTYYPSHGFIYTSQPDHTAAHPQHQQHPGAVATATTPTPAQPQTHTPTPSQQQPPSPAMVMTTVPLPSCGTLFQHFVYACQPFWCHRHTVTVPSGMVYDVGDFRVRVGDVRQTAPAARVRGTVIEVEWRGPTLSAAIATQYLHRQHAGNAPDSGEGSDADDDSGVDVTFLPEGIAEADVDAEYAAVAALIREFWGRLGVEGAREAILVPDVGREVKAQLRRLQGQPKQSLAVSGATEPQPDEDPDPDAGVDVARQFMEIFRFNR
ncbi:mediator complex, subunit Med20 [Aspergillus floccosus]